VTFWSGNDLDMEKIGRLLAAMRAHSKPIKPARLGVIGVHTSKEPSKRLGLTIAGTESRKFSMKGSFR
jgi:hypothetical protein